MRRFLPRRISDAGVNFPTGTALLGFVQTLAPPGWLKSATHDDKAVRIVSGTPSSGGSSPFSTVHGLTATDNFTLLDTHLSSHTHTSAAHTHGQNANTILDGGSTKYAPSAGSNLDLGGTTGSTTPGATGSIGGDTAHGHAIELRVNYVDVIFCTKQ